MIPQAIVLEWHNQTTLHPIGLIAVLFLGLAMLFLPRRYALAPMLVMACFVAPAQRVVVMTFDFNLMRMMVLFGWMRIFIRGEGKQFRWNSLDTLICVWAIIGAALFTMQTGSLNSIVNRAGFLYDALGMYFLFRLLLGDWDDVLALVRCAALIGIPVAAAFLVEKSTGRNMFAFLGGVPEETKIRNGRLRCQGAFAHPILAGSFWAALLPLLAGLFRCGGKSALLSCVGIASAGVIIIACASSTPLMAVIIAAGALSLYLLRNCMAWIRIGTIATLIVLHFVMLAPLWHLLARVNFVSGSTGWYRYKLIDEFFQHFPEWWLVGTPSTAHWWTWGSGDVTNQYVFEGVNGGLLTLLLFIAVILLAFRYVGRIVRDCERRGRYAWLGWAIGVSLFVHVSTFFAVAYFGQMNVVWYLTLAMIGSCLPKCVPVRLRVRTAKPASELSPSRLTLSPA